MILLQDVVTTAADPNISEFRAILLIMAGGMAAVFAALGLAWKGRTEDQNATIARMEATRKEDDAAHERSLQAERDRTARAEKIANDAMARVATTLQLSSEQTLAIREFGTIVKEGASESRRTQDKLDVVLRTNEDLRRAITELAAYRQAAPNSGARNGQ